MQEIFSAKTLEEAKSLASNKFGVDESNIEYVVLEEPKKSLGIFKRGEYRVQATYNPPVEDTPQETVTVVETVESIVEDTNDSTIEEVQQTIVESVSEPVTTVEEPTQDTNVEAETEATQPTEAVPTMEEVLEKAKVAQEYVGNILEKMGIDPTSEIIQTENGAIIDFKGDGTGTIIGKRGETLDALQYLSAMICNKGEKEYYRITLDSCGYRAKRKVILKELAKKIAKNVLRTGRSQSLEPMNPYERRIIHATISEIEGVTSHSVGEEPFRKVIISSTNPAPKRYNNGKKNYRGNGGNRRNGGNGGYNKRGGNGKYYGGNKKKNFQPRSLDLKTSFEKDYKRPKPEDNLKQGLYGKIEL